jgi:hypothetical protein
MVGHRCRHALAAAQPGGDELEGVSPVDLGARTAARRLPGPAPLEQDPIRLPLGREGLADLPAHGVDLVDAADEPHRPGAVARRPCLLGPPLVAGRVTCARQHLGQRDAGQPRRPIAVVVVVPGWWHIGAGRAYSCPRQGVLPLVGELGAATPQSAVPRPAPGPRLRSRRLL